jgi:hypothetical protein
MTDPYHLLAADLQASTSSQPAKEWLSHLSLQLQNWPSTTAQPSASYDLRASADIGAPPRPIVVMSKVGEERSVVVPAPASAPAPAIRSRANAAQVWLDAATKDLRATRHETRARADRAFNVSLGLGIVGGLVLCVGLGLAFGGVVAMGVTSSITGGVSGIFSGVFANLYKTENGDLKQLVADLRKIEEARIGLWLADQLTAPEERDQAIRSLIERGKPDQQKS